MPNRLSPARRRRVYQMIVQRDGAKCKNPECAGCKGALRLEIDHVDNDKANWALDNLQLLCKSCNVAKGNRWRADERARKAVLDPSADGCVCVCENGKEQEFEERRDIRSVLDVKEGGTTFHANALQEPNFRSFVLEQVIRGSQSDPPRFFTRKELVAGGSESAQCSIVTGNRHMEKLANPFNGLVEVFEDLGEPRVRLRANTIFGKPHEGQESP